MPKIKYNRKIVNVDSKFTTVLTIDINEVICKNLTNNLNTRSISDVDIDKFDIDFLKFDILSRYSKVSKEKNFNNTFRFVHDLFKRLNNEQLEDIVRMLYIGKMVIFSQIIDMENISDDSIILNRISKAALTISKTINNTFTKEYSGNIRIIDIVRDFCKLLYVPDLTEAGTRPQDSSKYTFYYIHYIEIYAIMIVARICFPIIGEFLSFVFKINSSDAFKEIYVSELFNQIILHNFDSIYAKLSDYVENQITRCFNALNRKDVFREDILHMMYHADTPEMIKSEILSILLIKDTINKDLWYKDEVVNSDNMRRFNMLSKIDSSIKIYLKNLPLHKGKVKMLFDNYDDNDEENSRNKMEIYAYNYMTSIDKLSLAKGMVDQIIKRRTEAYNIPISKFNQMTDYYNNNIFPISVYNEFISTLLFYHELGGSSTIKYLSFSYFIKLISISQIELIHRNVSEQLIYFLTVKENNNKKILSKTDSLISYLISDNYKYLRQMINIDPSVEIWDGIFKRIMDHLFKYDYIYNSSNYTYELLNSDNKNNMEFKYDSNIMSNLVDLTYNVLSENID